VVIVKKKCFFSAPSWIYVGSELTSVKYIVYDYFPINLVGLCGLLFLLIIN